VSRSSTSDRTTPPILISIFGPPAVGKMTVGQELAARTGFQLFHAHRVLDLLTDYFPFESASFQRLVRDYKRRFFEEAAHSRLDLIMTCGRRFDLPSDTDAISSHRHY
jgi:hypothetical protein